MASQLIWTANCAAITRNIITVFRKRRMLQRTCWMGVRCVWCSGPLGHSVSVSFHMGSLPSCLPLDHSGTQVHPWRSSHVGLFLSPHRHLFSFRRDTTRKVLSRVTLTLGHRWLETRGFGAAVMLILSDFTLLPAATSEWEQKAYFRAPLIRGEYAGKVGRRWRKRGPRRSLFTAWINQLSSAVRNGINQS